MVDPDTLKKQREEKRLKEEQKKQEKEARKAAEEQKKRERLVKGKLSPTEMFKSEESKKEFGQWDENGIPTHDVKGEELAKSRKKKLTKEWDAQKKLHDEYQAFVASGGSLWV